ncbi:zinc finger BED domain-containing protein 5-like [Palaemon carinicauda]|uniref:zinc finger BED domain-containing protein 5-like n=1 Tax=Palaemon carinicauda TaxID=392227 RepID=UPI0035B65DAA
MSNESMVPSKLKKLLTSKHSSLQDKDLVYFQRLLDQQSKQRNVFEKTMTASERAQLASIEVAEIIALKSKSHTLAESVILPACKKIVKSMFGEKAETEISKIPLSNDTIHRRILDLSENIEKKVQKKLQDSTFALTVDESTDISNTSHLLAFVRFIDGSEIINQFLCCKGMSTTTRGQDIFDVITDYLREMNLTWKSCVGICTDGAPCMTGCIKGFVSLAEKENPDLIRTHCFLHREVLISKISQEDLKLVLHQLVEIVNYIKTLDENIDHYFPSLSTEKYDWIRNPFMNIPSNIGLQLCEEEELATISSDRDLKIKHSTVPIDSFWISVQKEYPTLSKKALSLLLQFSTSYLCELGFSTLNNIKTKKRERLRSTEEEMRVCLSHIRPNIEEVAKKHQAQVSH